MIMISNAFRGEVGNSLSKGMGGGSELVAMATWALLIPPTGIYYLVWPIVYGLPVKG